MKYVKALIRATKEVKNAHDNLQKDIELLEQTRQVMANSKMETVAKVAEIDESIQIAKASLANLENEYGKEATFRLTKKVEKLEKKLRAKYLEP